MNTKTKSTFTVEAVVTRADGTVENLGIIATSDTENKSILRRIIELFSPKNTRKEDG